MEKITFKFIDILDSPKKKKYFRHMRKYMLEAFPGESAYIKIMRKILKRKIFFPNEIFRLLLAFKNGKVVGGAVYRFWFDLKVAVLEYIFISSRHRGEGIGTMLYKRMRADLKRMKSIGLFFSIKGTDNLEKFPVYNERERVSRQRREQFYRKLGARPLSGINYLTPPYFNLKIKYANPFLCYDPLKKKKKVLVSSNLVRKVIKRIMKDYYEVNPGHYRVKKIFKSIQTRRLRWRK